MKEEKKLKALQEMVDELDIDLLDDSIIKSNKLPFLFEGQLHQVLMPTQRHLTLAKAVEDTLKIKLLLDKKNITRKALIQALQYNQDIDILSLEKTLDCYGNDLKGLYLSLVPACKEESLRIKTKINDIKNKHMEISIEISSYLSVSIENRVETAYIQYLTALCTEKYVDDKWILAWSTHDDYEDDNTNLPNIANLCFSRLFLTLRN